MNVSAMILPTLEAMWPLFIFVAAGMAVMGIVAFFDNKKERVYREQEVRAYEKKPYVFDVFSELTCYKMLVELFGDRYYVFPQIGYGHLIQLRKGVPRKFRNRFDKKSADFVLCDKVHAIAQVVIELDGTAHLSETRIGRDARVDRMMKQIGLPIVHINPTNLNKETLAAAVGSYLR